MDQTPAAMDRHLEVVQCHKDGGILLGASSLTGRYWYGSLWYYQNPELAPDVEKCTAGVQLEAGLTDACWVDAARVLVAMDTGGIALWELTDNLHTFIQQSSATEHDNIVSSVCVCQSGNTVISASHDNSNDFVEDIVPKAVCLFAADHSGGEVGCYLWRTSVKIWDLETFSSIHTYKAHFDAIYCVHSHKDTPNVFLTASQDGTVCLWDTRKSKPVSRLDKSPLSSIPTCVAWQPGQEHSYGVGSDSGQLVVKDTRAAVTENISVTPHHRGITRLQFSPHINTRVATISEDCSVMVVDISSGEPKQIYRDTSHNDFVKGVAWSGENTLYSCGWDAQVCSHIVTGDGNATEGEPTKMEVNGDIVEPAATSCVKDSLKLVQKNIVNGDSDTNIAIEQGEET